MKKIEIKDNIYYLGTNDRRKRLFENNWPLPQGVSYNSYLIKDDKNVLIDTLEYGSKDDYIYSIEHYLDGAPLDFLVVNHMEPDHASMIGDVLRQFPDIKIIGNSKTFEMLQSYYGLSAERFKEVSDGEIVDLGRRKLQFYITPWVHWPETMMTYEMSDKILFTCDAFGTFGTLDGGVFDDEINFEYYIDEMRRYYSNIVGKYSLMVRKALDKLSGLEIKVIAPSHGPVWRSDISKVVSLYDGWSAHKSKKGIVIAYASMYGNTEKMADYIARTLTERGCCDIKLYDVSKTHVSYILSQLWDYKGIILGTCAYNGDMHPQMHMLTHEITMTAPKNKVYGFFGSSTWNGAGVKSLKKWAENNSVKPIESTIELTGGMTPEKMVGAEEFAELFIKALNADE